MKKNASLISIIMPVYNMESFISEAITSVLKQTFIDFELIIVNDASTDKSSNIAHSYDDSRIHVFDFLKNKGCYFARNYGMNLAQGKYICVMDADDICLSDRLEKQYVFLEENTDIGLIGSAYQYMNDIRPIYREIDPEIIKLLLLRYCYLLHPTCMIRHSLVKQYNLYYDENFTCASDYDWQVRASRFFPISNLNEVLLFYRQHEHQISNKKSHKQKIFADQIRFQQLNSIGLNIKDEEKEIIINFLARNIIEKEDSIIVIRNFIKHFVNANKIKPYYLQERLITMLNLWLINCEI